MKAAPAPQSSSCAASSSLPKLTKLELRIMETFWKKGSCSIRELQEAFPERKRPPYTTVQTIHLPARVQEGHPAHP
jgi:hypothetical protein